MQYPNEEDVSIKVLWRELKEDDIDSAYEVHKQSIPPIHGMVRPDSREQFENHISSLGVIIGGFTDEQKLVAYGILDFNSSNKHHLCEHLKFSTTESETIAVLDGAATLPSFRGHHLHRIAISQRILLAASKGFKKIVATVAPSNTRSLRGLLDSGLRVIDHGKFYNGLDRLIVMSSTNVDESNITYKFIEYVISKNMFEHQASLSKKLIGYECVKETILGNTDWYIKYGLKNNYKL